MIGFAILFPWLYFDSKSFIPGSSLVYQAENTVHRDSAIETFFQCGMQGTHPNMLLELLCQIFAEPAFDELRTKVR